MRQPIRRRDLLAGASAAAATMALSSPALAKANFTVPDGACDCHFHIYDSRFPYAPNAQLKPPFTPVSDYRRQVQQRLGVSRGVVVTPSTYAVDNRVTVDALKQFGAVARGVAVVHADVPDAELKALHAAGVRGARIQFGRGTIVVAEEVEPLAKRLAAMGWHMQLNMPGPDYMALGPVLRRLPCTIVFDHLARVAAPDAAKSEHYRLILDIMDTGRAWMKVSSPYTDSLIGPPNYPDTSEVARDFIAGYPDRVVWASNWPYPDRLPAGEDPLALLNILEQWAPSEQMRHRILVENPEALYGFDPKARPKAIAT
jgi:predicted TIM-barrel fold metal-dependent hydrolase